jgi:hypothetical protein
MNCPKGTLLPRLRPLLAKRPLMYRVPRTSNKEWSLRLHIYHHARHKCRPRERHTPCPAKGLLRITPVCTSADHNPRTSTTLSAHHPPRRDQQHQAPRHTASRPQPPQTAQPPPCRPAPQTNPNSAHPNHRQMTAVQTHELGSSSCPNHPTTPRPCQTQ